VHLADIRRADVVYDLGAGTGSLTAALARRARRVVAIELDHALATRLRSRFKDVANVDVHAADLLTYPFPRSDYVVFASPPFDITTTLIDRLTSSSVPPRDAYLVLQREAARRFAGRPRMTLAALLIAPWFTLRTLHRFQRSDFNPAPSVDAVFVRLHKRGPPLVPDSQSQLYRDFVVALFTAWRPTVANALALNIGQRTAARLISAARVEPGSMPTRTGFAEWLRLYRTFASTPVEIRRCVAGAEGRLRRQQRGLQKVHSTRVPRDALHELERRDHLRRERQRDRDVSRWSGACALLVWIRRG